MLGCVMEGKLNSNQSHESQKQKQEIPYELVQPSSSMPTNFMNKETGAYDLGELDQALLLYLDGHDHSGQEQKQTLNIFPSQPMHVVPSNKGGTKRPSESSMELCNTRTDLPSVAEAAGKNVKASVKHETNRKGTTSSSEHEGPKTPDPKTLRRLAQNREAARKSRLRKKAYVQQLESSRFKLTQLEQELHRARTQGIFFGDQSFPPGVGGLTSEVTMFDIEYGRWLEEHHRLMCELRAAVQEQLPENELSIFVENCLAHHNELANLKAMAIKIDVFHLVSGTWRTPAERCFLWMGDFRPSDLIKIVLRHIEIEPLAEQQVLAMCGLQQSTRETEDALTQGLDALHHSLSDTVASDELSCPSNMANYMGHMALAVNKLSTLEDFVRQAENLREQTLRRLHQILTTRQAARGFLAIAEYFHRLRALSSLWQARPRQE